MQGWIITGLSNRLKERRKPHVPKKPHSETHCQAPTKIEKPKMSYEMRRNDILENASKWPYHECPREISILTNTRARKK